MLEDEFYDIVSKAWDGLGLSIEETSLKTGIKIERLHEFSDYNIKPTLDEIKKLSATLNLNFNALLDITNNKYKPKEFNYDNISNNLKIIPVRGLLGDYAVYAYIVAAQNECIIIDTAGSPELIIDAIIKNNLKPLFILLTHSHHDHIGGIKKIKNEFGIDGYIFKSRLFDRDNLKSLKDGQFVDFAEYRIKVIYTPGHTQDSATFCIEEFLFVGDLIFAGSLGRPNWSYKEILKSAKKILDYPENYHIFPGHGPSTTVEEERKNNAFIL